MIAARYQLTENLEDSSRNQFHAALRGTGGSFVDDPQFRRVLLLTGDGSHVQLPGQTLGGEDTITVTGTVGGSSPRRRGYRGARSRAIIARSFGLDLPARGRFHL